MQTDNLIRQLAADAAPVRRLPSWPIRLGIWLGVAVTSALVVIGALGARRDLATVLFTPEFALEELLLLTVALTSAAAALIVSVPGAERSALVRWLPLVAAAASLLWLAGDVAVMAATSGAGRVIVAWRCILRTVLIASMPGALLLLMVNRAAPLRATWAGLLALLATAALGFLGTNLICAIDRPLHVLLWHGVPMMAIAIVGALLGRAGLVGLRGARRSNG